MLVRTISADEYYRIFPSQQCAYSSRKFISLNSAKAELIRYFAGFDDNASPCMGIVMGCRNSQWLAPFSAPYSAFDYASVPSLEKIYDFISDLSDLLSGARAKITLPPPFHSPNVAPRFYGVLANYAEKAWWEYNYHFNLAAFDSLPQRFTPEAKRHFKRATTQGFAFEQTDDASLAYGLIAEHHKLKGYPMAMSLTDVLNTRQAVPSDFFMLSLAGEPIAAAYVHQPAPGIAQLINWGDKREFGDKRPMNMLAYRIAEHYASHGFKIFDLGPASTSGVPNTGLCRFKASLGCELTLKPTFAIN